MKYLIFGSSSKITKSLCSTLTSSNQDFSVAGRSNARYFFDALGNYQQQLEKIDLLAYDNIIINVGSLLNKNLMEQEISEQVGSLRINLLSIVNISECVLNTNNKAKICIIGSESATKGSYDTSYFLSKAALEKYICEKRLKSPAQRIFGVAPSTIVDAGMTTRRDDSETLARYLSEHPKSKFLTCDEVADIILELFSAKFDYYTNDVLQLNGGKFARMRS